MSDRDIKDCWSGLVDFVQFQTKDLGYEIERLLQYGLYKQLLGLEDVYVVRNTLLTHFELLKPYSGDVPKETLPFPTPILENMLDCTSVRGGTVRELEMAKIMGFLTPRASEVSRIFWEKYKISPETATDYFFNLSLDTYYIQKEKTDKNLYWQAETDNGKVEITINLSRPEKDPKDIAAAKLLPQMGYPKCVLCPENTGYAGRINHPARQNHRIIPLNLLNQKWYFQYSPHLYYEAHCVIIHEKHIPMAIGDDTFAILLEFVTQFPHYFIGSNADLPIVGGSILSHDHLQGGRHHFPIEYAKNAAYFTHPDTPHTTVAIVDWPLSTVRLRSADRKELAAAAVALNNAWKNHSDPAVEIYAFTESPAAAAGAAAGAAGTGTGTGSGSGTQGTQRTPHSTVTPIARRVGEAYELDIVLRNNRTNEEYPDGIFHPHKDVQHIKKENIGLPEAMGLAVLPSRLGEECAAIARHLEGETVYTPGATGILNKHEEWIKDLVAKHGTRNTKQEAGRILEREIGVKFSRVMEDAGVFKRTTAGRAAFIRFLEEACGLKPVSV